MKEKSNPKIFKNIIFYARRYFPWALVAVLATVSFSFLEVMKANILRAIVDLAQSGNVNGILPEFLKAVLIIICVMVCIFLSRYAAGRFSSSVMRDVKRDSARHISQIPLSYMNSNRSGELLSKMSTDADSVQSFMEGDFIQLIQLPFTIVFYAIYLIWLNPILFLACFATLPILIPLGASFAIPFRVGSKKYMKYLGKVSNTVADMVGGISVVKSYNMERALADKYQSGIERATNMALKNDKCQYKGSFIFNLARNIPTLTCLVFGGYLCFKGSLTLGALIAFSSLLGQTLSPLMRASSMFFNLKSASASAERVFSIINEPSEQEGSEVSASLNGDVPAIQFENVSFGYEEDKPVLKNLNLSIKKGETVGFAGASGCGKSTILGLICGFYRPSSGRILIGGIDMGDRNLKAVRSLISYVSQDAYLFSFSIYDNIAMGKSGATKEEVIAAAKAAYAHDFIMETENGYDTIVGERGSRLSGGQIQRISIARAMLKDAPILLLDEATSALDVKAEAEVQKALDNLSIGRTVLVVAHRLSTIKGADRIAVIDNGIVAECGSHDELLKKDGLYAKLQNVHSQQGGEAL